MRHDYRVNQGWFGLGLVVLMGAASLGWTGPAEAQQRYELDEGDWVKQAEPEPGSPEAKLNAIRRLIAQGKGKKAKHAADDWIERNDGHALLAEAYLTRGDANVARKHFFKSLYDYEYVIREFSGSEQFHTAMEREFELAKLFLAGTKRRLWGMRILPATEEAEEILVRIQERGPGSELGEKASLMLSDYYFDKPQMDSAAEAYDLFLINYPQSEQREWAMLRLIQANLARFKGPRFDATGLIDAGQRLKTYRAEYPASSERIGVGALLIRIDESLAMRDMIAAGWHVKRKQNLSAIYLYQRVVVDYPRTAAAQDAVRVLEGLGAPVVPPEQNPSEQVSPEHEAREQLPPEHLPAEISQQIPPVTSPEVSDDKPTELPGDGGMNPVSQTLEAPALDEAGAAEQEALVEDVEASVTKRSDEIQAQSREAAIEEGEVVPEATDGQGELGEQPSQTQRTAPVEDEVPAAKPQPEKP
jgi:tetratricopeptide (TPR) repeat protein